MARADRRHQTELVIERRAVVHRRHRQAAPELHRYHKNDPMGRCGNRHCSICSMERAWKHLERKRERVDGHRAEREAA